MHVLVIGSKQHILLFSNSQWH